MEPNSQVGTLCRLVGDLNVKSHATAPRAHNRKQTKIVIFMIFIYFLDILALFRDDINMTYFWREVDTKDDVAVDVYGDMVDNTLAGW